MSSLFLPCGFQRLNLGCQAWQQLPFPLSHLTNPTWKCFLRVQLNCMVLEYGLRRWQHHVVMSGKVNKHMLLQPLGYRLDTPEQLNTIYLSPVWPREANQLDTFSKVWLLQPALPDHTDSNYYYLSGVVFTKRAETRHTLCIPHVKGTGKSAEGGRLFSQCPSDCPEVCDCFWGWSLWLNIWLVLNDEQTIKQRLFLGRWEQQQQGRGTPVSSCLPFVTQCMQRILQATPLPRICECS